jgi:hypothetical protein
MSSTSHLDVPLGRRLDRIVVSTAPTERAVAYRPQAARPNSDRQECSPWPSSSMSDFAFSSPSA